MRSGHIEQSIHSVVAELRKLQLHNHDYGGSPMKINLKSKLMRFLEDRSGAVTVTAAVWLGFVGIALAGLGIDGANLYRVKDALQQSSNRAAVAGAAQLATSTSAATTTAKQYSSDSVKGLNSINAVQSVSASRLHRLRMEPPAGRSNSRDNLSRHRRQRGYGYADGDRQHFLRLGDQDDHFVLVGCGQWVERRPYRESRCRNHSRYDGFDERLRKRQWRLLGS